MSSFLSTDNGTISTKKVMLKFQSLHLYSFLIPNIPFYFIKISLILFKGKIYSLISWSIQFRPNPRKTSLLLLQLLNWTQPPPFSHSKTTHLGASLFKRFYAKSKWEFDLDMRRLNRNSDDQLRDQGNSAVSRAPETKCGLNPMKSMGILVACLMILSVVFSVSVILEDLPSESIWSGAEARVLQVKPQLQGNTSNLIFYLFIAINFRGFRMSLDIYIEKERMSSVI